MEHGFDSPVDLPGAEPVAGGLGWTTVTIAVAAFLLLATNAVSLEDWVEDMPQSALQQQALGAAEAWRDWTDLVGLGAPRARLHGWWKAAEAARF